MTQYLVEDGKGLDKAMELAAKAASNTPTTNFAVLNALPRIAESDPASGLLTKLLMASLAEDEPGGEKAAQGFPGKAGGEGGAGRTRCAGGRAAHHSIVQARLFTSC